MSSTSFSAEFIERSCSSKTRYSTQVIAEGEADRIWIKNRSAMRAYSCPVCDGWHLASSSSDRDAWSPTRNEQREFARNSRQRERRVHGRRR